MAMQGFALWMLGIAIVLGSPVAAQVGNPDDPVPARRLVQSADIDFFGSDLRVILDTTLSGCKAACLADGACHAFTFNIRSNSCFPKSAVTRITPYNGAVSARVLDTDAGVLRAMPARAADLDFLTAADLRAARAAADMLSDRHRAGERPAEDLRAAAAAARAAGRIAEDADALGAALTLTDAAADWVDYGRLLIEMAATDQAARRDLRARALSAGINGYLRTGEAGTGAAALVLVAEALEALDRGRASIPALRLAQTRRPSTDLAAAIDRAVARFGFRIVDTQVENEAAAPRICAVFSEDLVGAAVDYAPFVQLGDPALAVSAEGRQLCIDGVRHGARYQVAFREGLPSASGEALSASRSVTLYVRDRPPAVRFPTRAYVLPRGAPVAVPVETVNAAALDLALARVSDRNLLRAMQEDFFARPIPVWQRDTFETAIGEEIWRGRAEVPTDLNRDMTTRLPLDALPEALTAGIYALTARVPGTDPWEVPPATQWFVVSDIGLIAMDGVDGLHVTARSLGTTAPLGDVRLTLVSRANRVLGEAVTDAEGQVRFAPGLARGSGGAEPALLLAEAGAASDGGPDDLAFLSLSDPEFDLSDRGVAGRPAAPPVDLFVTTDRGAYRAGETVHVTALARDGAGAVAGLPVTARLLRPDGVEYSRVHSAGAGAGGHVFALPVAAGAPRGIWRLELRADPDAPALASQTFLVEDFLPERIDFDLSLPEGPVGPRDAPGLTLSARYLFGPPAVDLAVEGEVRIVARDTLEAFPGYRFGRQDTPFLPVQAPLPRDLRTDAEGISRIALDLPETGDPGRPLELRVIARLSEGSGRPVERRLARDLVPEAPVLGLRPLFDGVVPEDSEARFAVLAVGPDMAPAPAAVRWTVNRVETRYQWYRLHGDWNWEPVTTRTRVATGDLVLDGRDPAILALPVGAGRHEIRLDRTDGPPAVASVEFWSGWYAPAETTETPDTLEVALDRDAYQPGDTARLRVTPRSEGTVLVTVLSNRVIYRREVAVGSDDLAAGSVEIDLPVTEDWGTGAYVTAALLRPMDAGAGRNPARALGLAHAAVDPGPRRLGARFDVPDVVDPRSAFEVVLDVEGLVPGQAAHATIAAVDVGILNLTGFEAPDPEGHYFGQRRLGVGLRDLYGRLIDGMTGAEGRVRSGGDAVAQAGLQAPPPTEQLMAQFSGPLTVGPDGAARTRFDLPAFNGTVRLMAVVWSDTGIGQASADVLVRDPVVVTPSLPRFVAPGDDSRLLLEFAHASGPSGAMDLAVTASPDLRLGPVPQVVTLADEGRARVAIPFSAETTGAATISVALTTPDGRVLAHDLALPVQAGDPPVARQSRFDLGPGQTFSLDSNVFAGLVPGSGSAAIAVGPLARFDASGLLQTLDAFPYGCTEQVTSRALPLLYLSEVARAMGLGSARDIDARIDEAISQVLLNQASNGGFGLWRAQSGDLWLDAYVGDFLSRARAQGRTVPDTAFRMAMDNLRNRVNFYPDFDVGGGDLAYALMVLAREGAAAAGDLRYYADQKAAAFDTPLGLAQMGAALALYGDQRRADVLFARAGRLMAVAALTTERAVFRADYGSDLRDAAAILALATEAGSDMVDRAALADLVAAGTRGTALSTQEATWVLLATHALVDRPGAQGFTIDGAPVTGPLVRVLEDRTDGSAAVAIRNGSDRTAMLTLTTLGVPQTAEPAGGTGYTIARRYFTPEGEAVDPAHVAPGARLIAMLEVVPQRDVMARLMVADPLPAGFEIENPNLLRAGDVSALDWLLPIAEVEHAEFRQDRFLAAIDWSGTAPFRLAYRVRAITPGSYHHPAASVEDMYRPSQRARTATGRVVIAE